MVIEGDNEVPRSVKERVESEMMTEGEKEVPRSAGGRVEGGIMTGSAGEVTRVVEEGEEEEGLDVDQNQSMQQKWVLGFLVDPEYHAGVGVLEPENCGDPGYGHPDLSRYRCDDCDSESYYVCDDVYRYGCDIRLSSSNSRTA